MKRIFVFVLASLLISSCTSHIAEKILKKSAEDVKIDKLKTACDCVEAGNIIMEDILDAAGEKSEDELEKDEAFMKKIEIFEEVGHKCSEISTRDEMRDCKEWEDFESNMQEFEEKF